MTIHEKNDLLTREGYRLELKGDKTRIRFTVVDTWTGKRLQFELGDIAANILVKFISYSLSDTP